MPAGPFDLGDKVAVVTGGGSGIGAAIASVFARQHARVVVLDVDERAARRTTDAIAAHGGSAAPIQCDLVDSRPG